MRLWCAARILGGVRVALLVMLSLAFAAPAAFGQSPTVITDPAAETEPGLAGEGGDQYTGVDGGEAVGPEAATDDDAEAPAVDDGPIPSEPPPPDATGKRGELHVLGATSASSPAPPAARAAPRSTLPFTGQDPAPIAGAGLLLLAAGLTLRRRDRRTRPCPR